jgi:hypothetical protein
MNARRLLPPWRWVLVSMLLVVAAAGVASACPNCTNGISGTDDASQKVVTGYFWSILFMMSMPFALLTGFGGYMYLEVRRARAAQPAPGQPSPGQPASGQPAASCPAPSAPARCAVDASRV